MTIVTYEPAVWDRPSASRLGRAVTVAGHSGSPRPPSRVTIDVVIEDIAKAHLHQKLRSARETLVWKLDGLSEYAIRRPMTPTGTNLLGLVKHNAISDSRYFGSVFGRPFP